MKATPVRPLASWGSEFAAAFRSLSIGCDATATTTTINDNSSSSSNSSPVVLEQQTLDLPRLDSVGIQNQKTAAVKELLKHQSLLQSVHSFLNKQTTNRINSSQQPASSEQEQDVSLQQFLRDIQLQVSLRLALWQWAGDLFVKKYNKHCVTKKKSNKKKNTEKQQPIKDNTEESFIVNDIIGLLQLACVKLGNETDVVQFFMRCIRRADCEALPAATKQIWDWFEKKNPYDTASPPKEDSKDSSAGSGILALQLSPPVKKKKKRPATAPNVKENQPPPPAKEDPEKKQQSNSLLPARVSLTAPRRRTNSLLKNGGRATYVGSHFNSSLSNTASLFRQAPAVTAKTAVKDPSKLSSKKNSKKRSSSMAPPRDIVFPASVDNEASTASHDLMVPATPVPKARHSSQKRARLASSVPETPLAAVLETPQPSRRAPAAGLALVQPRPSSSISNNNDMPTPPAAASSLVAEAFNALAVQKARRERRQHKSLRALAASNDNTNRNRRNIV